MKAGRPNADTTARTYIATIGTLEETFTTLEISTRIASAFSSLFDLRMSEIVLPLVVESQVARAANPRPVRTQIKVIRTMCHLADSGRTCLRVCGQRSAPAIARPTSQQVSDRRRQSHPR